jgi:hypothetical protein
VQRAPLQLQLTLPTRTAPWRNARWVVFAVTVTVVAFDVVLVFVSAIAEVVSNALTNARTSAWTETCKCLALSTVPILQG